MPSSRQLAAIMFTDIVGYTALMGRDENKAFQSLALFKKIAHPLVEKYHGSWHKDLGDGALMSFSNVLDAVHCAIAIQKEINTKFDFRLRMGIHLGDIIFDQGDALGDGVNIASRLQNEAPAGGICISEPVFKNIQNKEGIGTQYLGSKKLKNVPEAIRLYQIKVEGVQTKINKTSRTVSWPVVIGLMAASSVLTGILVRNMQSNRNSISIGNSTSVHRTVLEFPNEAPLALIGSAADEIGQTALALSPDASNLVYVAQVDSVTTKLYLYPMDGFKYSPIEGTEGAYFPFFSPDGQWIGFYADKKLKKISIAGGSPVIICNVSLPSGAFWKSNSQIVIPNNEGQNLMHVSANGGIPELVYQEDKKPRVNWYFNPSTLFRGESTVYSNDDQIVVSSLVSGNTKDLHVMGTMPQYVPTGHLVYADFGRLFAVSFNDKNLEIEGSPFPVIESIRTEIMSKAAQMSFARNGTLIYVPGSAANLSTFFWADRRGHVEPIATKADIYGMFTLSPDGTKIAFSKTNGPNRIGIFDLMENQVTEIASNRQDREPVWSPDGKWIAYFSKSGEKSQIRRMRLGSLGEPEVLLESAGNIRPYAYVRDGRAISFFRNGSVQPDIENLLLDGSRKTQTLVGAVPYASYGASFSPDQRYFAYNADESGRYEVYVQPYPPTGERWQLTTNGCFDAIWSPNGNEIFFRRARQLFSVEVKTDSGFSFKKPKMIFEGDFLDVTQRSFDISPDGQRFLMLAPANKERIAHRAVVVTNWFEELKKLTPMK